MADQELYEVERLLQKKVENKKVFYLVRWKNYGTEHDSWEPAANLRSCYSMFKDFEKRQKAMKSSSVAAKLLKKSRELSTKSAKRMQNTGKGKKASEIRDKKTLSTALKSKRKVLNQALSKAKTGKTPAKKFSASKSAGGPKRQKGEIAKTPTSGKKAKSEAEKSSRKASLSSGKRTSDGADSGRKDKAKRTKASLGGRGGEKEKRNGTVGNDAESSDSEVEVILNTSKSEAASAKKTAKEAKTKGTTPKDVSSAKGKSGQKQTDSKAVDSDSPSEPELDVSDTESDSDENILYSLNEPEQETSSGEATSKKSSSSKKPNSSSSEKQNGGKVSSKHQKKSTSEGSSQSSSRRMSLLDFKKPKSSKPKTSSFEQLLRPSSPVPFFTPLKTNTSPLRGAHVPTSTTLSMESLAGDVPTYHATPAGPLSPSSMSYKTLLDNLPSQLHPRAKGGKKKDNGNSSSASTSSGGDGGDTGRFEIPETIERRISVRATECVFRYKQIVVKKCHRYTQIWLNTQTTLKNAFNPQVVQEVVAALNIAKYDDSTLVLFSSIGNFFCSGTDLHFLVTGDRRVAARQMADALRELTKAFITFPKPVVAAVGGAAVGLGVALLCLCDVVYTSDKASFHLPYAQLSQTPECCSSFTLPLTLGLASANELLFGGRRITAIEAYQLGLVSQVFWPTSLMQEVIPRTQNMANCSAKVLEGTKLLIRSHHRTKLELTNETECNLLLERWSSPECQRAIEAYLANERNFSH